VVPLIHVKLHTTMGAKGAKKLNDAGGMCIPGIQPRLAV